MSFNSWISILSLVIALLALAVAAWQARRTERLALNAHQIQVIADAFREIRSVAFLEHYKHVLTFPNTERSATGFESLHEYHKESAYAVCYFFEHLGVLVARNLIAGDVLITTMRTLIVRSWDALEHVIIAERKVRESYQEEAGRLFLPHFEQLAEMARTQQSEKSATVNLFRIRPFDRSTPETAIIEGEVPCGRRPVGPLRGEPRGTPLRANVRRGVVAELGHDPAEDPAVSAAGTGVPGAAQGDEVGGGLAEGDVTGDRGVPSR